MLGIFAVSMQILAGHPQYVFYTGVAVFIYTVLHISKIEQKIKTTFSVLAIYLGAAAITAVQLFTAIETAREGIRATGVSYAFASMFSFPLENFLTLFAPNFFGNDITLPYWGRWYIWEMSIFIGITGVTLAIYGAFAKKIKAKTVILYTTAILFVLAIGSYTPLFWILYNFVPG